MSNWTVLPNKAVTKSKNGPTRKYVVLGNGALRATSSVHGYAEQNVDGTWSYWKFAPIEKGETVAPEPLLVCEAGSLHGVISKAVGDD